jgi:hypothetical protein
MIAYLEGWLPVLLGFKLEILDPLPVLRAELLARTRAFRCPHE